MAIKRTQLGPGRKLRANYLGPYVIKKTKANDTYDVAKVGDDEGPACTVPSISLETPYVLHTNSRTAAICAGFWFEYIIRRSNDDKYFHLGHLQNLYMPKICRTIISRHRNSRG